MHSLISIPQSGEALLLGMFPSNGSRTEVIDLNTMDPFYDYITPNGEYVAQYYVSILPPSIIAITAVGFLTRHYHYGD